MCTIHLDKQKALSSQRTHTKIGQVVIEKVRLEARSVVGDECQ
jgi:hypothetical protein